MGLVRIAVLQDLVLPPAKAWTLELKQPPAVHQRIQQSDAPRAASFSSSSLAVSLGRQRSQPGMAGSQATISVSSKTDVSSATFRGYAAAGSAHRYAALLRRSQHAAQPGSGTQQSVVAHRLQPQSQLRAPGHGSYRSPQRIYAKMQGIAGFAARRQAHVQLGGARNARMYQSYPSGNIIPHTSRIPRPATLVLAH